MEKYLDQIARCRLFDRVEPADLPGMLQCLQARLAAYPRHSTILLESEPATHVGLVLEGAVQVCRNDFYGNRSIVAQVTASQLFGEVFACAGVQSLPVSVVAATDARILLLDCRRVMATCSNACPFHQRLIRNLLQILAEKNLTLNQKLEITGRRTTREKLLAFLQQQAQRSGSASFTISFDRQQLADYLGVDRSAMSTELGKLKREGLLDFHKSRFTLLTEQYHPEADEN